MKTKKLLSILLAILMLAGVCTVGASAADELNDTDVMIAGTVISGKEESWWLTVNGAITADGASASNYNIHITPATESAATKLTLKNAQLSEITVFNEYYYTGIVSDCSLDIELQGTNKFDIFPEEYCYVYGIVTNKALKIFGNGSLAINLGNENALYSAGITGETVDISGNAAIKINQKAAGELVGGYSLYETTLSDNANLEITETCLNVDIPDSGFEEGVTAIGYEITYNGLNLSDNAKLSVKITDPDSVAKSSLGLEIKGELVLSDNSHINISCCDAKNGSAGISMNNGDLTVSGTSTITAKAGNASDDLSYGIYLYNGYGGKKQLIASDSAKVTAIAGNGTENIGIGIHGTLTVTDNANISATAGSSDSDSYGMYITSSITVSDSAGIQAVSGNCVDTSTAVFCEGIIAETQSAYISASAGTATNGASCAVKTAALSMSDEAKLSATAKSGKTSFGVYADSYASLSDKIGVEANAENATVSSCGFYAKQLTMTEMKYSISDTGFTKYGYLIGRGKDAENAFGIACEIADISGIVDIDGAAGFGTNKSYGFCAINEGIINCSDSFITGISYGSEKYSAGIYLEGSITVSGNSAVLAVAESAEESYGIASKNLTVSSDASVEAIGETQAVFYAVPNLSGYENVIVYVNTAPEHSETEWDGTSALGGEESAYKYIFIDKAPFKLELNFFQKILLEITLFFTGIIEFFSSLFSFAG